MVKLIIQITKLIVLLVLTLLVSSCKITVEDGRDGENGKSGNSWFSNEKGSGNISTQSRKIEGDFSKIKVSNAIVVTFTQSNSKSIEVTTDVELLDNIVTEINNSVLEIYVENSINPTKIEVAVSNPKLNAVETSSASEFIATNEINTQNLTLESSSASNIKLTTNTAALFVESSSASEQNITLNGNKNTNVNIETSSASTVKIEGIAGTGNYDSSSASSIKAGDLQLQNATTSSSSGSNIKVFAIEKLNANASSGSSTKMTNKPKELQIDESSGASIN